MEQLSIPEGLDVLREGDSVVIRRSWRTLMVIPLFFFLVFWFGFLGFWYYLAFTEKGPLVMFLFPLLHLAAGVGLAYFAIASLVNKTDVIISGTEVRTVTGPLPWRGNRVVAATDIHGFQVRERRGNKGSIRYALLYVDAANKERPLIPETPRREQAEFIAASIGKILGLPAAS